MRRLGASALQRLLVWIRSVSLPPWKDALIFVSVVITVAGSVAFLGLRLQKLGERHEAASGTDLSRMGEIEGLPDVLGPRCSDQTPKRL